jgi:hypothetical protein
MRRKSRLPKLFVYLYGKEDLVNKGIKIEKILEDDGTEVEYGFVNWMIYVRTNNLSGKKGKEKGKPVGVIIINNGYCGWSLCHENDEWNKYLGIYKAICKLGSKKTIKEIRNNLLIKINGKSIKNLFTTLNYIINKMESPEKVE